MSQQPTIQPDNPQPPDSSTVKPLSVTEPSSLASSRLEAMVDLKRLRAITSSDPGQEKELINLFIKHASEALESIPALLEKGDGNEIVHRVHKLAGSAASLGAIGIVAPLKLMEDLARQGHLSQVASLLGRTNQIFRELCQALKGLNSVPSQPSAKVISSEQTVNGCHINKTASSDDTAAVKPSEKLIDLNRYYLITGKDLDHEKELANLYLNQGQDTLKRLPNLIDNDDCKEVARLTHKLAGSSGSMGFISIIGPLKNLEHQAQKNQIEKPNPWLEQATTIFNEIQQWFESRLKNDSQ